MTPQTEPVEILLVEDDPGDVLMTTEALADSKVLNNLNVVSNGE
ncbi:MAG: response regulator, partial [Actinomycetes bacterium]